MIEKTLARLEAAIKTIRTADHRKKAQLSGLYRKLKAEVRKLPKTHGKKASSIAGFAEAAAREAARSRRSRKLLDASAKGLSSSVDGFEASHPRLVETVNDICLLLAKMGI